MFGLTLNYFAVKAGSFEVQGTENHCAGADVISIDPDNDDLGTDSITVTRLDDSDEC